MSSLKVNFAGVQMKNPIVTASGTYGFGREYEEFYPLSTLGGISSKGITLELRKGNPTPRVAETPAGMLNSVGLQNPGVKAFIEKAVPYLQTKDTAIIANLAGSAMEDYVESAKLLDKSDIDMIELNISCPNVHEGGATFGVSCPAAYDLTKAVRQVTSKPLMVKLTPNVTDITQVALAVEEAGADAVSLINTLLGMKIDIHTRRPVLANNVGGLSGPAVFPVALRMVWQVANAVKIPVMGLGGIATASDVIEMMMAGARAVQVGTAMFTDPFAPVKIIKGLEEFLEKENIKDINEIVGTVKPW